MTGGCQKKRHMEEACKRSRGSSRTDDHYEFYNFKCLRFMWKILHQEILTHEKIILLVNSVRWDGARRGEKGCFPSERLYSAALAILLAQWAGISRLANECVLNHVELIKLVFNSYHKSNKGHTSARKSANNL